MFILGILIGFGIGAFVGFKYPTQVGKTIDSSKKMFNDVKEKLAKKDQGPTS